MQLKKNLSGPKQFAKMKKNYANKQNGKKNPDKTNTDTANNGKGGFFSESEIRFSNLQISKKNTPNHYPELEI